MPKVRLLVPRDIDGKPNAAGAEVDVSDELAADLRAAGAASLIEDEKAAEAAAKEGSYSGHVGREDAPKAEEKPKKGKD